MYLINLFWKGCPETSRQKILSIPLHTSNRHTFSEFTKFKECAHAPIEDDNKLWTDPNTPAYFKMNQILCGENNKNLEDLRFMTGL